MLYCNFKYIQIRILKYNLRQLLPVFHYLIYIELITRLQNSFSN